MEIITYMVLNENLLDLVASIGEQGFFSGEPLLIIDDPNRDNHYLVVEGNRRLAAVKLLNNPTLTTKRVAAVEQMVTEAVEPPPTQVPTIEYDSRESLLDYLGYRHVTGVDQWDALAKARYLAQLREHHRQEFPQPIEAYRHIAKKIGSRSDYVRKLVEGFRMYESIEQKDFYDIPDLDEGSFKFSLLTTAVSYSNIQAFLELESTEEVFDFSDEKLKELTDYLFRVTASGYPRIPDSRDIKKFNRIVDSPSAYEAFTQGRTLEDAEIYTDGPAIAFEKLIETVHKDMRAASDLFTRLQSVNSAKSILKYLAEINSMGDNLEALLERMDKKALRDA